MLRRKRFDLILSLATYACLCVSGLSQIDRPLSESPHLEAQDARVDFVHDVRPIFEKHCYACHGPEKQKSGFRLDVKSKALGGGDHYGPLLDPSSPGSSPLLDWVGNPDPDQRMPPPGPGNKPLSPQQVEVLRMWIAQGARWPEGIDKTILADPKSHWSFVPIAQSHAHGTIDAFIQEKLHLHGLEFSSPALPMQWLRRVSLDLHGLPPDEELATWFSENHAIPNAYEMIVDQLLASPHYAERWAQHWLDVVRYADTHGFEVNTERPHAWHYRDYVIGALNEDLPFDEFIRHQIAGDQLGQDTATGFLITASVLLPGQIGADEPSKRLARQDAIDEIVVNIGQTFLGLSIGCARCHDHKFDPVTQEDYYAMQAFVAGVEYEDRLVETPRSIPLRQRKASIDQELRTIDQQLLEFEPIANPKSEPVAAPNSKENVISFEDRAARFVKMEIWNANHHPTLGLLEPCIDELEIWTSGPNAKNVALAQHGGMAVASGSRESDIHKLQHIHDGRIGNESSWMSDQAGKGWVMIELAKDEIISKIVWGRDRLGQFTDRTATAYRIQIGLDLDHMHEVALVLPERAILQPNVNVDRIKPVETKSVRFTILDTNNLEPCIDEFEILDITGANVALASFGTVITSSGDTVSPDRHELRLVNDGRYGNSSSWMSNTIGRGSLSFDFPSVQTIHRFVWGRDREGRFQDRLPINYSIEVLDSNGKWILVADASDRVPYPTAPDAAKPRGTASNTPIGLTAEDSRTIEQLDRKKKELAEERTALAEDQKAFAGRFRTPDGIHLLLRGDPEQPNQSVGPRIPQFFGDIRLEPSASEAQRRLALADWIASPSNPLTPRVIANRIWQGHFGIGLVETPNDFGLNGLAPSHPELLDWLAQELLLSNWSLKSIHRKIVLSRTYRQSTQPSQKGLQIDADSRLLWRYPRRRMEAESIRDSILKVSGQLNTRMFGRGYDLFEQRGGLSGFKPIETFRNDGLKRMIYAHKVRRERDSVFGAFDCPDAGQSTGLRRTSTTPIQALNLLNSRFTIDQSAALAHRIRAAAGSDLKACIQAVYQQCLYRSPTSQEFDEALSVVSELDLEVLCRAVLNCNEFLFFP